MKLSKEQTKTHNQAIELLQKDRLTKDEKFFVIDNYIPAATNNITNSGVYFTPYGLAKEMAIEVCGDKIIDLCAGIGGLSFALSEFYQVNPKQYTCVEINPEFVEIGKKILPEANWIQADCLDRDFLDTLVGEFDTVISNPPYGNVKTGGKYDWLKYKGSNFEYKIVEIGAYLKCNNGVFILPQESCPFRLSTGYNTRDVYRDEYKTAKYNSFVKQSGLELSANCGIDIYQYRNMWKGTKIITEIAICDYNEYNYENKRKNNTIGYCADLFA